MKQEKAETNMTTNEEMFTEYLHKEYTYIAEAHFKTIETISTFFKHYLAIMTIPIILLGYLLSKRWEMGIASKDFSELTIYAGSLFAIISAVGCAVMLYIMNLRHDALLYARTVNGIRKFFYDKAEIDITTKLRMRALPQTTALPAYFEGRYFLPVVFAFALFNSFYVFIAYKLVMTFYESYYLSSAALCVSSFFMLHFLLYMSHSHFRELGYLKSNIIGIDIDGVLNKHREHFCKLIKDKANVDITPQQITHIPVHELGLTTAKDDIQVFNDPKYWIEMPVEETSQTNMRKLCNIFKLKVYIFTYRGWPDIGLLSKSERVKMIMTWRSALAAYEKSTSQEQSINVVSTWYHKILNRLRGDRQIINRITELWLKSHTIECDKLVVEKGNDNTTDPRGFFYNRLNFSRRKRIKYFVEDDLEKAIKLAFICDVVFLIAHPYNDYGEFQDRTIPTNIIRVETWNDIYREIRKIS